MFFGKFSHSEETSLYVKPQYKTYTLLLVFVLFVGFEKSKPELVFSR